MSQLSSRTSLPLKTVRPLYFSALVAFRELTALFGAQLEDASHVHLLARAPGLIRDASLSAPFPNGVVFPAPNLFKPGPLPIESLLSIDFSSNLSLADGTSDQRVQRWHDVGDILSMPLRLVFDRLLHGHDWHGR